MSSPTLVGTAQHARATATSGAGRTVTLTVPNTVVAGDLLLVEAALDYQSGTGPPAAATITGGAGGTWTTLLVNNDTTNFTSVCFMAKYAAAGDIGAALSVTCGISTTNSLPLYTLTAWHGAAGFPKFVHTNTGAWSAATGSGTVTATGAQYVGEANSTVVSYLWASTWNDTYAVSSLSGSATSDDNYVDAGSGGMGNLIQSSTQASAGTVTAQTARVTAAGSAAGRWQAGSMILYGTAPTSQVGWRSTALSTTTSITVPADVVVGDLMVVSSLNNGGLVSTPTGWTQVVNDTNTFSTVWVKQAVAGDIGTAFTFGTAAPTALILDAFYNWGTYNTTSIASVYSATRDQKTSTTSLANPAGTAPLNGCAAYQAWTMWGSSGSPTFTAPNTVTQSRYSSISGWEMAASYQAAVASGTLPTVNATASPDFSSTAYSSCIQLVIVPVAPPLAPTLGSPANATYEDTSGTPTFTWAQNPTLNDGAQNAFAFRRKISGGSYSYWNSSSSSWQSTIVWNSYSTSSYTFPSGSWADGNIYNWSVATQESVNNGQGPFAADFTVTGQSAPSVAITAPAGTIATMAPTVTATATVASGATISSYRLIVYTAAQVAAGGFDPGTTIGVFDSGVVASSSTAISQAVSGLSNNVTYTPYMQVTETGAESSAWTAGPSFTVSFDPPQQPTVTAVGGTDPATGAPVIAVSVQGRDNLLSASDASFEGSLGTWTAGANTTAADSTAAALDGSESMSLTATAAGTMSATTGIYTL